MHDAHDQRWPDRTIPATCQIHGSQGYSSVAATRSSTLSGVARIPGTGKSLGDHDTHHGHLRRGRVLAACGVEFSPQRGGYPWPGSVRQTAQS